MVDGFNGGGGSGGGCICIFSENTTTLSWTCNAAGGAGGTVWNPGHYNKSNGGTGGTGSVYKQLGN